MTRLVLTTAAFFLPALANAQQAPGDLSQWKEEPVSGGLLLVIAYLVMWLVLAVFVGRTAQKQARLEADLRALEARFDGLS